MTIDGKTGEVVPDKPKRIRLSTMKHVRLEMCNLYQRVANGELDSREANRRIWHLRQISDVMFIADIEPRIAALEKGQGVAE